MVIRGEFFNKNYWLALLLVFLQPSVLGSESDPSSELTDDEPAVEVPAEVTVTDPMAGTTASGEAILSYQPSPTDFQIPQDEFYKKSVNFWIDIYSKYTTSQGVIHDADYLDRIYEVVDFSGLSRRETARLVKETKKKWRNVLLSVHLKQKSPEKMSDDQLRVFKMFPDSEGQRRFVDAAARKRLRYQLGQKDRFQSALIQSGRYLPLMEDIFRSEGLPVQLTRLPFVESSFNLKARSKVGASGIWQFMRTTGRLFLRINQVVDERNDPIRASEAAAKLLKQNYESLLSWPLAIVAYNHGRMGMMRAQQKVGSNDIKVVLKDYRSRSFGFASRNFYWELVAAIEVEKNYERYFGKLEKLPLFSYTPVFAKHFMSARDLAQGLGLQLHDFQEFNPSFTAAVYQGQRRIPPGYPVRIPDEWGKDKGGVLKAFDERYALIPDKLKHAMQR